MKIQIDTEITNATAAQITDITNAQNESIDVYLLSQKERDNRKSAYDKFLELGLTEEAALTISGWVENPTPPREV
jgi:hypothetical protein